AAVAHHSPQERDEQTLSLVREVMAGASKHEKASDLPPHDKARLLLAGHLAAENLERMGVFLGQVAPLRDKPSYGVMEEVYRRFDAEHARLDWEARERSIRSLDSLEEQVDRIRAYLNQGGELSDQAHDLLEELVDQRGPAARAAWMVQLLKP